MAGAAQGLAFVAVAVAAVGLLIGILRGDVIFGLFLMVSGAALGALGAVLNGLAVRRGDRAARLGLWLSVGAVVALPLALLLLFVVLSVGGFS